MHTFVKQAETGQLATVPGNTRPQTGGVGDERFRATSHQHEQREGHKEWHSIVSCSNPFVL